MFFLWLSLLRSVYFIAISWCWILPKIASIWILNLRVLLCGSSRVVFLSREMVDKQSFDVFGRVLKIEYRKNKMV